jgi:hypothetical protein
VGDRRRCNQCVKYLQFCHFCAVDHCHVEGQAVPCEDELSATVFIFPSVSQYLNGLSVGRSWPFASLFVTQVQRDVFKLSITNSCGPTSNSTG